MRQPAKLGTEDTWTSGLVRWGKGGRKSLVIRRAGRPKRALLVPQMPALRSRFSTGKRFASPRPPANRLLRPAQLAKQTTVAPIYPRLFLIVSTVDAPRLDIVTCPPHHHIQAHTHTHIHTRTHARTPEFEGRLATRRGAPLATSPAVALFYTFYCSYLLHVRSYFPKIFMLELFCGLLPGCVGVSSSRCDILSRPFRLGAGRLEIADSEPLPRMRPHLCVPNSPKTRDISHSYSIARNHSHRNTASQRPATAADPRATAPK